MKNHVVAAAIISAFVSFTISNARAEEKQTVPEQEQAEVDKANKELDRVYAELMAKTGRSNADMPEEAKSDKNSLRDAQRAWIKWRDAEALFIARHGGAIGGSALRTDYLEAELKLINDRTLVLKAYLSQPSKD